MTGGSRVDPAEVAQAIDALAGQVARRLIELRRELGPGSGPWAGAGVDLDPEVEWTLAADGILGPDGILGLISGAIRYEWPGHVDVGWPDPEFGVAESHRHAG
ncbi:hypothetical protein EDC02_5234 [Micromonospora sp. Llam0]|uniref:hypothetical protein n=1 Tax=Micromonospora sp. Llam0 TaxID=2485143 RepID=UPI000F486184|nr:hypothetical protein [Micromonospora sp. Llam0]ROO63214.1 hypothetical protein EDC02_5234 [Micromonospora sp. Llam0]